jgi:prolipoprotein diacylglyceryl transferase
MIAYDPIEVLFRVGGLDIHSYGFALSMAFLAGFLLAMRHGRKKGLDPLHQVAVVGMIVLGSMAGARAYYVLEHADEFAGRPGAAFHMGEGGLSAIGGIIGGGLLLILYARVAGLRAGHYLDACVPGLCLGISITRIGCFLNWDDYGLASTLPWAVNAGDFARHPTQIYLLLNGLLLFVVFLRLRTVKGLEGRLFPLFLLLYGPLRFLIEFLRDSERYAFNLTATQLLIPPLVLIAGILFMRKGRLKITH